MDELLLVLGNKVSPFVLYQFMIMVKLIPLIFSELVKILLGLSHWPTKPKFGYMSDLTRD